MPLLVGLTEPDGNTVPKWGVGELDKMFERRSICDGRVDKVER